MWIFADIVLAIHFCVVLFIVSGLILIPIGYWLSWDWINLRKYRITHLGMMIFITLETLCGLTCPLTSFENYLRGIDQSKSFLGYWLGKIIYWELPSLFFIVLYCMVLGLIILMWRLFPPLNIKRN